MKNDVNTAVTRLAERVKDMRDNIRQDQLQRRNQVVDLYGIEYTSQGDTQTPASFYVSVTPDLVYYERFEFKIIIKSFAMPVGGGGATGYSNVNIDGTSLAAGSQSLTINGTQNTVTPNPHTHAITPNPHTHTNDPHNHSLDAGITLFTSSINSFSVWIEGIDMTEHFKAQYGGEWVTGNGVYPTNGLETYDILEAVGHLPEWQRGIILKPGYKLVEFRAEGAYNATLVSYLKLSHVNR